MRYCKLVKCTESSGGHSAPNVLIPRVEVATALWRRALGLMGRAALPADEALFIPHCGAIHTCWMRAAMDAVFVDRHLLVVRVVAKIPPFRFPRPCRNAWGVFELASGASHALQIRVGDQLALQETSGPGTLCEAKGKSRATRRHQGKLRPLGVARTAS